MPREFVTMDVFTTAVGTGNPLAVVFGADGLDETRMQMIAREFNLSETTFVFSARPDKGVPVVRIFTPARELPFAGHPVIGTAAALANEMIKSAGSQPTAIDFEVPAGLVHAKISGRQGHVAATCIVPRLPTLQERSPTPAQAAAGLGLIEADVLASLSIQTWDAGYPVTFVPLATREALQRTKVDLSKWPSTAEFGQPVSLFPYWKSHAQKFNARMFAPMLGIREDPATGGAVAAMAGHIVACYDAGNGLSHYEIEQGVEMGRPSRIDLSLEIVNGSLTRVLIGGAAVEFSRGTLSI
jgi:trans-2,3-dihydro-3-hydroxyanthranilate isomerase